MSPSIMMAMAAQESLVAAAYRPLEVVETTRMDDWVAVTLIRR